MYILCSEGGISSISNIHEGRNRSIIIFLRCRCEAYNKGCSDRDRCWIAIGTRLSLYLSLSFDEHQSMSCVYIYACFRGSRTTSIGRSDGRSVLRCHGGGIALLRWWLFPIYNAAIGFDDKLSTLGRFSTRVWIINIACLLSDSGFFEGSHV